jgi:ABC-2 type transport system ATP-binding protein
MPDVTVEAAGLTKRFGPRTAVEGVSFTSRQGDVLGLVGPNGAGKTTIIRLLTTILTPTSGSFSVAGVPSTDPAGIRRRAGVLPESAGYPGRQTGAQYLRNHARLCGRSRPDAMLVAERLLAEVGLAERASSRISTYSRGMRQRLGIARALVNDPTVVFLDEPTLGLDPAGQRQVLAIVRDVARRRAATVVLSTHTLPEVEEVCTSVLVLRRGRLLVSGGIAEVTAAAVARRCAQLRVPADMAGLARASLADVVGVTVDSADDRRGLLSLVAAPDGQHSDADVMNAALLAVLAARVPILSFELQRATLSDAFLAMTGEVIR